MEKQPSVAIIVLNWNGFADTVECMESLRQLNYRNHRLVLVDNGSSNNEGTRLKEKYPDVYLIQNAINRGFAGGNNDGINWALENGFDYIVNLNNDCIVTESWLLNLVEGVKLANADFASSRIMYYPDTNIICSYNDILLPDLTVISTARYDAYGNDNNIRQIFVANGAASIYSSRCLQEVKLDGSQYFDEMYFAYGEDVDLGLRLKSKSFKGICVPNAVAYHKHSRTAGEYSDFTIFLSERNRLFNEIFNYPASLAILGEAYLFLKLFTGAIYSLFYKRSKARNYLSNLILFKVMFLFIQARIFIIYKFIAILNDRRRRRAKGFIGFDIMKTFSWKIVNILK